MNKIKDKVKSCSHTACSRGNLCPNFTPRYIRNSFSFPSCIYNPIYLLEIAHKVKNANKQPIA